MDSQSLFSPGSESGDTSYPVEASITKQAPSLEAAVEMLQERDVGDLKRARRHHRRALTALKGGCYDALGDRTRVQLVRRLTADLEAINRAIQTMADGAPDDGADGGPGSTSGGRVDGTAAEADGSSGSALDGQSTPDSAASGGDGAAAAPESVSLFGGAWRAARWLPTGLRR